MTTYHLKRYALGRQPSIELTKAQFDDLLLARRRVLDHLAAEELFDVVMRNYEELERELLSLGLRASMYWDSFDDWIDAVDAVQLIGRRVSNLLTTTHAYCDQVPHLVSTLFPDSPDGLSEVKELFRTQHASNLGYRVCTEIRKYAQHRGAPVHRLNRHASRITRSDQSRVRAFWIAPHVSLNRLRGDDSVKSAVLAELEEDALQSPNGDRFQDLRPYIRDYMSCLGRVHLEVRERLRLSAAHSDRVISEAIERYVSECDPNPSGLSAVELNEDGLIEDRYPAFIMREPIDRRKMLERRNRFPTRFDTQTVTNELL